MSARRQRTIIVLGMVTKMPVPGVLWQALHYLVGFRRLGYEVLYVEDHGRSPSMFVGPDDMGSARAASFLHGFLSRFDLGDRWAFRALHDDGRTFGRSEAQLLAAYASAELILNLHGGTRPRSEHTQGDRLVYVGTDPVQLEIELWQGRQETFEFLDAHCAIFTFAENYGRRGCGLPLTDRYHFRPTRQPVVLDFWENDRTPGCRYTTIANWHQPFRTVRYRGVDYTWSKDREFRKFAALPEMTGASFELALSSIEPADRIELAARGWKVTPAERFGRTPDAYRDFIWESRGEFTVAKDQNVRLRSGWFSDRSATYLAAGRPVITQETGFTGILPTGSGLRGFTTIDEAAAAIEAVEADPGAAAAGALEIAKEAFDARIVLARLLTDVGVEGPVRPPRRWPSPSDDLVPLDLELEPISRRPVSLTPRTERLLLERPLPVSPSGPRTLRTEPEPPPYLREFSRSPVASVIVVTHGNLPLTRLCLESLLGCTDRPPHEVVVVDNASRDGTPEYLETLAAHDPRLRLVLSPRNLGFAAACNVGARIARGELIVFLNNDTVLAPGWLERLLTHLSGDDVGAVNPVTNRVGTEAEVEDIPRTYGEFLETAKQRAIGRRGKVRDAQMLAFFCLAIRRSRWEEIGPLDERFGLGLFEDDDYSLRLRAAGYRLLCAEDVFVYHFGEGSLGRLFEDGEHSALFETNRKLFEAKWNRPWQPSNGAHKARYGVLVERVLATVSERVPPGSVVATISRGDERLLALEGATGWHFPRDRDGGWAGHYPPDGPTAVAELEKVRRAGARFLLIPASASWWLDHYQELRQHLSRTAEEVMRTEDLRLFELVPRDPKANPSRLPPSIRPVFIIGSPRSGTSVLTWALGQHPNLYPLEETVWFGSFHRGVDRAFELGSRRGDRSQLSAMQISRGEFFRAFGRTIDDLIRSHRQWPAALVGRDVLFARARSPEDPKGRWVDGTPENSFFVEGLTELFPDARFLHLLREPGAVVRSLRGFDRIGGRRHTTSEAYERWLRHVRACIEAEEELGPERVKRILHRDLVERPERMVRDCLEFLGEDFTPDCLLPLSRRINSSGTPPPPAEEDELRADPGLIAEAEALERRLMGAGHLQTVTEEAR